MRVAITGATGNVGTALVERLMGDDRVTSVVGIARRRPDDESGPGAGVEWVEADVATDDLRPHLAGVDAVVHLAWQFQPTHRPVVTWRANAVGSARVFDAVADAGVRTLVHASSVGAYSPGPGRTADESWPTHSLPTAAYGREKAYVERVLDTFEARHPDIRVVRLRPAFIFQWPAATEQRRIFAGPFLPNQVIEPGRLPVLPLPQGLRFQALHADDAAAAYQLALTTDVAGAFNIAADPVIDATAIADLLGTRPVEVPRPLARAAVALGWHARLVPADPALLDLFLDLPLLDVTRAHQELGWHAHRSGLDALRELVEGMAAGAGTDTPPLRPDSLPGRVDEVATGGVGQRG
jgi:nucleoside-diphosphate-sugar epimerase